MKLYALAVCSALCALICPVAKAATVNCGAGQTITAAINALPPATGYQTINVSGACVEDLYIPPNLAVALVGATGASLKPPAGYTGATVAVAGRFFAEGMKFTGTGFAAFNVFAASYATLSQVTIEGTGIGVQVSENGGVQIEASKIDVTGAGPAIGTYNNGTVEIDGNSQYSSATGSSITSKSGAGIGCYGGGNIEINADGGEVSISKNGGSGIDTQGCNIQATGGNGNFVVISDNKGAGINAAQSTSVTIDHTEITKNIGNGVYAQVSSGVQISGTVTISDNTAPAIQASRGANVFIANYAGGANTIDEIASDTNVLFSCYQSGKILVDQIAGTITPAPTAANMGCLQVGGP